MTDFFVAACSSIIVKASYGLPNDIFALNFEGFGQRSAKFAGRSPYVNIKINKCEFNRRKFNKCGFNRRKFNRRKFNRRKFNRYNFGR